MTNNLVWSTRFQAVPVNIALLGATMEMREVLCFEGKDTKNLLAYKLRDDKPLALGANFESELLNIVQLIIAFVYCQYCYDIILKIFCNIFFEKSTF